LARFGLTDKETAFLRRLGSPHGIQRFLDETDYDVAAAGCRSPRRVLREGRVQCMDGALFAAAALRALGHPPLIVDLEAVQDDDHVIAVFRQGRLWGAIARSNYSGLRYREPVYRTLRELVMSYFDLYYNAAGEKTLRSYTVPLNLSAFDSLDWTTRDEPLDRIGERLDEIRKVRVLTPRMVARLSPMDKRTYRAGMLGVNRAGLYKPPKKSG
jgi:hypothetical protein